MLTELTLSELRTLITTQAAPDRRTDLTAALDDLQRTIAAQSLAIRNLTSALRNHQVSAAALDALLPSSTLNDLLSRLGPPRSTPFSLDQARQACAELADQAARNRDAADLASIAVAMIKVVKAFV